MEIQANGGVFGLVETCLKSANVVRGKIQCIAKKYVDVIPAVLYPQSFRVSYSSPGFIAREFFENRRIVTAKPKEKWETLMRPRR